MKLSNSIIIAFIQKYFVISINLYFASTDHSNGLIEIVNTFNTFRDDSFRLLHTIKFSPMSQINISPQCKNKSNPSTMKKIK